MYRLTVIYLQLILKTKTSSPLSIHYFGLKGPFSDMKINTQIYKHDFTDQVSLHILVPDGEVFSGKFHSSFECMYKINFYAITKLRRAFSSHIAL